MTDQNEEFVPAVGLTPAQYETLMRPLNAPRVAKRSQGGKELSYLESWDIRAHLIRVFGFTNFDAEMIEYNYVTSREYTSTGTPPKPMIEVIYSARMRLQVRDQFGLGLATYTEAAVGSASGPASMLGEHHDNALKTAASDALKRCAINLGTQFGLGLYAKGSNREVVRGTVIKPTGVPEKDEKAATEEQIKNLEQSVGATKVEENSTA